MGPQPTERGAEKWTKFCVSILVNAVAAAAVVAELAEAAEVADHEACQLCWTSSCAAWSEDVLEPSMRKDALLVDRPC